MNKQNLTHKEIARALGVSETTVKSYRRKFPGCIPVENEGKPIRFTGDALSIATRIRDLFATGMSVKEIRQRLSQEFSWVRADTGQEKAAQPSHRHEAVPAGDISQGISNMAKSMVAMAQQQRGIVKRMQVIEGQLEELGFKGVDLEESRQVRSGLDNNFFEKRLGHLDTVTETLAVSVQDLTQKIDTFLGDRAKSVQAWREHQESAQKEEKAKSSNVISFASGAKKENQEPSHSADQVSISYRQKIKEPPRQFYLLPLVVRTADGRYISAGGRGRGRFSLNDLKAMLVHGFQPPLHYTLQWEVHGDGWWLFIGQPQQEESHTIQLLLMELPTQNSGNVIEILQLKNGTETVHPAEISGIIDTIGYQEK